MTVEKRQRDADGSSGFRGLQSGARQQLLRTGVVTDDELASLAAHEPGALVEDSARGAMADLLARLEGRERHQLAEIHAAQARLETGRLGGGGDLGGGNP